MNFTNLKQKTNRGIGSALLNLALLTGSVTTGNATAAYYSGRRGGGGYGRRSQSYLVDQNLGAISKDLLSGKTRIHLTGENVANTHTEFAVTKGAGTRELVIVDRNVKDYHLFERLSKPGIEVIEIPKEVDGLDFLVNTLSRYEGLAAVHLFSHARSGELYLGNGSVKSKDLKGNLLAFNVLNTAIATGGDLLLYGCELAKGEEGEDFLEIIKGNTHVDVAASDDLTGNLAYGGDWDLEIQKGDINATPVDGSIALKDFTEVLQYSGTINFNNYVASSRPDPQFKVGSTSYYLKVDGADGSWGRNSYNSNNFALSWDAESRITLSFTGGETFDPGSIDIYSFSDDANWYFTTDKGGSVSQYITNHTSVLGTYYTMVTVDLSALPTGATKLYITTGAAALFAGIDNFAVSNLQGASSNNAPVFTSSSSASFAENGTGTVLDVNANDGDGGSSDVGITFSITGGADAAKFSINTGTGALTFVTAPDFENPTDNGTNNVYNVTVTADDGGSSNNTTTQAIAITVTDVNDNSPVFTSSTTASVVENTTAVQTVAATDADAGTTISYSISGGADQSKFSINSGSGALSFSAAPDFENPTDANTDNVYLVQVTASDGTNATNQTVSVTVTDIDEVPPTVSSIAVSGSPATNATSVSFLVTFSESVTGVTAGDFSVNGSGVTGSVTSASGSGASYTVVVSSVSGTGTLTVDLNSSGTGIADLAGNAISGGYTSGATHAVDTDAPTVAITTAASNPTNASSLGITITFSEEVSGFTNSNVTVGNGSIGSLSTTDNIVFTGTIIPTANGAVTVDVAAGEVADLAGNNNTASNQLSITYDGIAPAVSVTSTASNPTNSSSIGITITFSEEVSGFTNSNVTVGNGSIGSLSTSDNLVFTGNITPTSDGAVTVDVAAGVVTDLAGNDNTAASQFSINYDGTAPLVNSISVSGTPAANATSVSFLVTFSESVTGVTAGDFSVNGSGVTGSVTSASGSGASYTIVVSSVSGTGTLTVDLNSSGTGIADLAGNAISGGYTSGATHTVDTDAPAVTTVSSSTANGSYKAGDVLTITVSFSETVIVTGTPQLQLETGSTDETIDYVSGSGSTTLSFSYTIQAGDQTTDLDYTGTSALSGTIGDAAGNSAILTLASPGASGSLGNNKDLVIDTQVPSVSITSSESSPTNANPIPITVTFSESVTGFISGDLTVSGGTVSNFSGSGANYTFDFTPVADGILTVDISSGTASDGAGNGNTAATQFSITYDGTEPDVSITSSKSNPTNGNPIDVTITFSEEVSGFTASSVTVGNGSLGSLSTSDNRVFTGNITPTSDGTVTADIAADEVSDLVGNGNTAATQFSITYDGTSPTVSTISPTDESTDVSVSTSLEVVFSENVNANTGNIILLRSSDNGIEQTISVTDGSQVSVTGSTVTITPSSSFPTSTALYVQMDAGTFTDDAGNSYAGISDNTSWNFTTTDEVQVSIDDPAVAEGASGTTTMTFTVTLSVVAPAGGATVDYTTSDGTATAGSDYTAASGTLNFLAGETSKSILVTIAGDQILESDETLIIHLSNASGTNVSISDSQGTGTITNDDAAAVTIADVSGNEDDGAITLTATLDFAVQGGFTVDVSTSDGTAAIADGDYTALSGETLTFSGSAGETHTFTVTPTSDAKVETDETVLISQSNLSGTSLSVDISDEATVSIMNDDHAPEITADQTFSVSENATNGTEIGTIEATDADSGTTFTEWTIVSGNEDGIFALDASTGLLTVVDPSGIDMETTPSYTLTITVSDGSNISEAENVIIYVGDAISPTVTLSSAVGAVTNEASVQVTATFDEEVNGFDASDISVTNGSISNLTTSDDVVFTFTVTAVADGTVSMVINAEMLTDLSGNGNEASNVLSYYYDGTAPVATLSKNVEDTTNQTTATITIDFTELVTGLEVTDFELSNGDLVELSGSVSSYSLELENITEGTVKLTLVEGAAEDQAGNVNAAVSISWVVDLTGIDGFEVTITNEAISRLNETDLTFVITDGEDRATFAYTITSDGGSGSVTGEGVMSGTETEVSGVDVSGLADGLLTLSVTLTDPYGNEGSTNTDTVIKETKESIPEGFSPNGDGVNDQWIIPGIDEFPNNKVTIFNRYGIKVWSVTGYDNQTRVWNSQSNVSKVGTSGLPSGTYFYVIEFPGTSEKTRTGYVIINR